jgi:hypothetical protein
MTKPVTILFAIEGVFSNNDTTELFDIDVRSPPKPKEKVATIADIGEILFFFWNEINLREIFRQWC